MFRISKISGRRHKKKAGLIMGDTINCFRGEHVFLSNFYITPVTYNGLTFTNSEAAFQAQKCENQNERETFCHMGPKEAKRQGRRVKLRMGWNKMRVDIMHSIVYAKFTQNPDLREKLLATGDAHLEEGNTWGDRFWGVSGGIGQNHLGKILMDVRRDLRYLHHK